MGTTDEHVIQDGQLALAVSNQSGNMTYSDGATGIECIVATEDGPQRAIKTFDLNGGGGGTVDQTYDPTSTNAQSGTAVSEAVAPALKNKATGTNSVAILSEAPLSGSNSVMIGASTTNAQSYAVGVGYIAQAGNSYTVSIGAYSQSYGNGSIAIGAGPNSTYAPKASNTNSIAIGKKAQSTASDAIQLGSGSNSTASTFQVFTFQLLDGTTGLIPAERLGTGYDATKTQVLKNVNGTLTWVDE